MKWLIIGSLVYLLLIFLNVVFAKVAEDTDAVDDADFWIIMSIFIAPVTLAILGAFFVAHWLEVRRYYRQTRP